MTTTDQAGVRRLHVSGAMLSDVGRMRATNEDTVVFVAPGEGTPERRIGFLALVADGMGGHAAGEIASALAAEIIRRVVYSTDGAVQATLLNAFETANRGIYDYGAEHPETKGMGTTCTAILISNDKMWLAHVGDSRAYLWRDGSLRQFSDDQTLHAQMIRDGLMTKDEALTTPGGNFLLHALGARETITPTISEGLQLMPRDRLFLCSDGLYTHVTHAEIAGILGDSTPQNACRALVDRANASGGRTIYRSASFTSLTASPNKATSKPRRNRSRSPNRTSMERSRASHAKTRLLRAIRCSNSLKRERWLIASVIFT